MNPLVLWIEHHRRADWQAPATRANYERVYGPVTNTEWRSALGQAYARERVQRALQHAHGNAYVGTALEGVLAFGQQVAVRVLVYGTDVAGHSVRWTMDVVVDRNTRMRDLLGMVVDAGNDTDTGEGVEVTGYDILPGSYAA